MDQARLHHIAAQLGRGGLTQEQIVLKIGALSSNPCATCVHCTAGVKDARQTNTAFGAAAMSPNQAMNIAAYCGLFPAVSVQANGTIQVVMRETATRCPLYNVTDVGAAMLSLGERVTKLEKALGEASKQGIKSVKVTDATSTKPTVIDVEGEVVSSTDAEPPRLADDSDQK